MKREEGKEKREEGRVHETERLALAERCRCARGGRVLLLKKFTRKRQKKALRYSIGKLKSYICLHAHFGLNA